MSTQNSIGPAICLLFNSAQAELCQRASLTLSLPVIESARDCQSRFMLCATENGLLGLRDMSSPRDLPVVPELGGRRVNKGHDPLMRAIGYNTESVIDCTAGWGSDAAHICSHGIDVNAIEQNAVVHLMLTVALEKKSDSVLQQKLSFEHNDSSSFLAANHQLVDVIYIDPMYPPKPGTAAPKKQLAILQNLLPPTDDPQPLVSLARQRVRNRVVVKRPHYAAPLLTGASGATRGKLSRYDIYPPLSS